MVLTWIITNHVYKRSNLGFKLTRKELVFYSYAYLKYGYWAQPLFGLTIYLYCRLWVSYYGWSYTRRPEYTLVSSNPSLYLTESLHFSLRVVAFFSQCSLQNYQPPIPHSLLLFIGQDKWRCYNYSPLLVRMGIQFHHLKVDAPSRKVELALELISTFRSPLSSDVLKGTIGQSSTGCLRVITFPTRLEMNVRAHERRGGKDLFEVFKLAWSYFSSWAQIGP